MNYHPFFEILRENLVLSNVLIKVELPALALRQSENL